MWNEWDAIEAAQEKAAAQDRERAEARAARKERPVEPADAPAVDIEAEAAVAEAGRVIWPHPIPPTLGGPQPTNADGSHRDGYWHGTVWEDRPIPKPPPPLESIRIFLRRMRDAVKDDVDEIDRPPWER